MSAKSSPERDFPAIRGIEITGLHREGWRSDWFMGRQTALDRRVAVKRLKPELAASPDLCQAFMDAGRQAANLVHPIALIVINLFPDQNAIVTEWCDLRPLRELEGKLSTLETADVGLMVMNGLAGLHLTGRAHGNLGLGNIFLGPDGQIRLNDFFLPPPAGGSAPAEAFAAPETLAGRCPDWRTDVYSLGKLLLHIAESSGLSEDMAEILGEMSSSDPLFQIETPQEIQQRLLKAKRREERRLGMESLTLAHATRRYRRIPSELLVSVKKRLVTSVETAALLSKVHNIGENGMFVSTDNPLSVGSIVELDITLQGGTKPIHAFGLVRWIVEPPLEPGMGVQFVEVEGEGMEILREYLRKKAAETGGSVTPLGQT